MTDELKNLGEILKWIAGVGGALAIIWAWLAKPVKDLKTEIRGFEGELKGQMMDVRDNMQSVQGMTDFLTGDRLAQAHAYWMSKGYCPPADKARLVQMHKVYDERGLNHLYKTYEQDFLRLPDEPPAGKGD